ncbi:hypothetical protein [Actinoallomurus acaciae]|uniref:Uncharacterized protein n=1 Tax=Actinoallomurus acaciae TaxID=502577 RepID=A0ABV5YK35_9ACTN
MSAVDMGRPRYEEPVVRVHECYALMENLDRTPGQKDDVFARLIAMRFRVAAYVGDEEVGR